MDSIEERTATAEQNCEVSGWLSPTSGHARQRLRKSSFINDGDAGVFCVFRSAASGPLKRFIIPQRALCRPAL
jgi:hypothetical protein